MWKETAVNWLIRYVLRERRKVSAYTYSYPLVLVNPAWQQHFTILYQNAPIQGFYSYLVEFRNEGNRSAQQLPFTISIALGGVVVWPLQMPAGCFLGLASPSPNLLTGMIDFINPKEKVTLLFWAINDTVGNATVTARAPDVEFTSRPWQPEVNKAYRIGAWIHQVTFWFGAAIILSGILYGIYRGAAYSYKHIRQDYSHSSPGTHAK